MMTPFDIPAAAPNAAENAGRRGARQDAGADDGAAPGKSRFADHWRMLAGAGEEAGPGERKGARANGRSDEAGTPAKPAGERPARLAAALDGLRLTAGEVTGRGGDGKADAETEEAPDPATLLRLALGGETAAATVEAPSARIEAAPASPVQGLAFAARAKAPGDGSETVGARATPGAAPAPEPDLHLATRGGDAQEPLRARVLHQATHFAPIGDHLRQGADSGRAPALALSAATPQPNAQGATAPAGAALGLANLQGIASAIAEAAGESGASRAAAEAAARPEAPRAGGPLRTLTIQLTPISLGKVTVEMRLVDGAMRVEITVADARALEMVRAERDAILALVRGAGVTPEGVTIQSAEQAQAGRQPGGSAHHGQGSGGGFDEGTSGREGAPGGDPRGRRDPAMEEGRSSDEASGGAGGGGRDIYL